MLYITRQAEMLDLICLRCYGARPRMTERVLDANPGLESLGPVLPMATRVTLPDFAPDDAAVQTITLWD